MKREPKKMSFADMVDALNRWTRDVEAGADPIEALHGHICSPKCWHQQINSAREK